MGGRGANIMLARPEDYSERDKGDYALPEAKKYKYIKRKQK